MAYNGQIDTSGLASALSQFVNPADRIGEYARQYSNRLSAEEDKAYNRGRDAKSDARLQVQDDRATEAYNQQKATRQGIIDTEQAKNMAAPYVKDVVAFNDPRYADALLSWQKAGNTDITESDKILSSYVSGQPRQGHSRDSVMPIQTEMQSPQVNSGRVSVGNGGGTLRGPSTYEQIPVPGYFKDGNQSVAIGTQPKVAPIVVAPSKLNSDGSPKDRGTVLRETLGSFFKSEPIDKNYETSILTAPYRNVIQPAIDAVKKSWDTASGPLSGRKKVLQENLPKLVNPTGSNKVLGMEGRESPQPAKEAKTALLSSIDMTPISKNGEVYFKDKSSGKLLKATDVGDAYNKNWVEPSTISKEIKGPLLKSSSKADVALGNAPVFKMSAEYVTQSAKASGVPEKHVTDSLDKMGGDYRSILDLLGKDNDKERNALREMVSSQASQNGLLPSEYDTGKAVDSIMPTNELTGRQKLGVDMAVKELDNVRSDKRWQSEMNFKEKEAMWNHAMDRAKLSLQQAGVDQGWAKLKQKDTTFKPISMYKKQGSEMVEVIANTPQELAVYSADEYSPGRLKETPGAGLARSGSSKIDLQALGGRSNIGGTSGADLVALSKRMKNEFKRVPQETIDAEIQNLSQGWISDGVNLDSLRENLRAYK